jgi:hypothetical protein
MPDELAVPSPRHACRRLLLRATKDGWLRVRPAGVSAELVMPLTLPMGHSMRCERQKFFAGDVEKRRRQTRNAGVNESRESNESESSP